MQLSTNRQIGLINGLSPSKIVIQPFEKNIYDPNSSARLKNIKFCNHIFLKALMIICTVKVTFLKCQILMGFFLFLNVKNVKSRSNGKLKNGHIKRKICTEKRLNCFLKDLSLALTNHGRHGLFSFLSSLPIPV